MMASLRSVLEEVERDSSARTPGGAVHPLTSDLMSFMEDLMNFEHIIANIDAIDPGKKLRKHYPSFGRQRHGSLPPLCLGARSFGSELHKTCHFDLSAYLGEKIMPSLDVIHHNHV